MPTTGPCFRSTDELQIVNTPILGAAAFHSKHPHAGGSTFHSKHPSGISVCFNPHPYICFPLFCLYLLRPNFDSFDVDCPGLRLRPFVFVPLPFPPSPLVLLPEPLYNQWALPHPLVIPAVGLVCVGTGRVLVCLVCE